MRARPGAVALLVTLAPSGCTVVTDPWQYDEPLVPKEPLVPLAVAFERLKTGCGSCLENECRPAYEACADDSECVSHATCRIDDPTPRGYFACGGYPSHPGFVGVTSCRACFEACDFGANWACVDRYQFPVVAGSVHYSQRLTDDEYLAGRIPFANHTVRACQLPGDCGPAEAREPNLVASTQTDQEGRFEFDLPVGDAGTGFVGLFVVSGPDLPVTRLRRTDAIVTARQDTQLLSHVSLAALELPDSGPNEAPILFQVNDCLQLNARGISAHVVEPPGVEAGALYTEGTTRQKPNTTATTDDGKGTGAVLGIAGPLDVVIEFRLGNAPVNRVALRLKPAEVSVLQVGPGSAETSW